MRRKSARFSQAPAAHSRPSSRDVQDQFPILPNEEILETLSKYNIILDNRNLSKPNEQITTRVFTALCHINGLKIQFDIEKFVKEENIPSHMDTLKLLVLSDKLQKLFKACKIDDFCLNDIIKPNSKDFKRQLCGWINFQRFCNNRAAQLNPIYDRSKNLFDKSKEIAKKVEELRLKRDELFNSENSMSDKLRKLAKAKKIADVKRKEVKELEKTIEKLNKDNNEVLESLEHWKYQEDTVTQNILKLKQMIVPSPQRLKQEKKNIDEMIAKCEAKIQEYTSVTKAEKEERRTLHNEIEGNKRMIQSLKDIIEAYNKLYEANQELHELDNKAVLLEVEAREEADKRKTEQERYNLKKEYYDKEIAKYKAEEKALKANLKKLKKKEKHFEKQISERKNAMNAMKKKIEEMEEKRKKNVELVMNKENLYKENGIKIVNTLANQFQKATNILQKP